MKIGRITRFCGWLMAAICLALVTWWMLHANRSTRNIQEQLDSFTINPPQVEQVLQLYQLMQANQPQDANLWYREGTFLEKVGQLDPAIDSYTLSLKIDSQNTLALHRLGVSLALRKQPGPAYSALIKALELSPNEDTIAYDLALVEIQLSKTQEAIARLQKILEKNPIEIQPNLALGDLFMGLQQYQAAIFYYQNALASLSHDDSLYNKLGCAFYMLNLANWQQAALCYRQAIEINPNNALSYNNLGSLLRDLYQLEQAVICYQKALELDPNCATTHCNLGLALLDLKRYDLAQASLNQAFNMDPSDPKTAVSLAMLNMVQGKKVASLVLFRQLLKLYPEHDQALAYAYSQLRQLCYFEEAACIEPRMDKSTKAAINRGTVCFESPFINVYRTMDPALNLAVAQSWSNDIKRRLIRAPFNPQVKRKEKLTIGYLSYDFFDHATLHLMAGLFRLHDRKQFQINIYSYGPDDQSEYRENLKKQCSQFIDITSMTDDAAAQKIFDDGVDILVDLKGHTLFSRPSIAMYRPAPIQISYLGFPGTSGADCFDYILTDAIVTPQDQQKYYTEKFLYMPFSYQVNDNKQKISERAITREEVGLPSGFVFASFNATYKLESELFEVWMELLRQVPDSVFWLYCDHQQDLSLVKTHLEKLAASKGIEPSRLIFATRWPKADHLKRLQLADLILDTRTYNGHTTSSDALWADVPVITLQGNHFASRVSSSLLTAVGMEELITYNLQGYQELALRLATHPKELQAIKQKLVKLAPKSPLFDTPRFVQALEKHYQTIHALKLKQQEARAPAIKN